MQKKRLMGMETATPAGAAKRRVVKTVQPAEAVPAESVRQNGHPPFLLDVKGLPLIK